MKDMLKIQWLAVRGESGGAAAEGSSLLLKGSEP